MSTSKKLTQLYTTEQQKMRLKEFILDKGHFQGHLKSMSKIVWLMMEVAMSLEEHTDFDKIHDDSTFKRELLRAIEQCSPEELNEIINFNVY